MRRAQKERKRREQVHRPQSNFHRAIPIYPAGHGILRAPTLDLLPELPAELLVVGDRVGATESNQVRQSIQFPHDSRIGTIVPNQIDVRVVVGRPVKRRQWIAIPANLFPAKTFLAKPEEWPTTFFRDVIGVA